MLCLPGPEKIRFVPRVSDSLEAIKASDLLLSMQNPKEHDIVERHARGFQQEAVQERYSHEHDRHIFLRVRLVPVSGAASLFP